ncbi:MAG: TrmH family RNA methyltransferase [Actinobacteria bacterium]|nr:TrmH family RNA methyltransferase [Actinomycetota bacterium]
MKQLGSTELKRLHRGWRRRTTNRIALVLAGLSQPYNVGAILRTAAAFRVEEIWLVGETPGPEHNKVAKTALGSERYVQLHRSPDAAHAIDAARSSGYRCIGLELADAARPLHETDCEGDIALVIGHEDRGLTAGVLEACDAVAYLPQLGRIGSLNVATATSIALYELRRQGWIDPDDPA